MEDDCSFIGPEAAVGSEASYRQRCEDGRPHTLFLETFLMTRDG